MKKILIYILIGLIVGSFGGFFLAKHKYDRPIDESVTRDTVRVTDTIQHYYPQEIKTENVRTEYRWLTRVETDTVTNMVTMVDTVMVGVPIESKHYHAEEYDAWVSGYVPSLDSIKVYQQTEYITETIIQSKPPNKWGLDIVGGVDYNTAQQRYTPYAVGELMYQPSRLQFGIQGGVMMNDNKAEPFVGGKVKIKLF